MEQTMTELQKKLLELMVEMDEICRKHDIKYMLFAGTSLGAERHGGFIPWDDDADIIMTLPNYEKLLSVMKDELAERPDRAFDALEWDTDYILTYARYVNTATTAIQRHTLFGGATPGIKLDIFSVVPTLEDDAGIAKHREDILAFSEVVCDTGRMMTYRPEGFYKRYREEVTKMEAVGREQYIKENLGPLMHRAEWPSSKCVLFSGMASNTKLYDTKIFEDTVYVPFEDTELPISKENILFSEQHLGRDWMAMPPDISTPKHLFVLDTERPYKDYVDLAYKTMDIAACREACVLKKEYNLVEKDEYRDILKNNQIIRNLAAAIETETGLKNVLFRDGQPVPESIFAAIRPYVSAQLSRSSRTHGLVVEVSRNNFLRILGNLIEMGRYYDADNIIRAVSKHPLVTANKAEIEAITAAAEVLRQIETLTYVRKDYAAAEELIEEHPEIADTVAAVAARAYAALESDTSTTRAQFRLAGALAKYGSVGEILVLMGICLERNGDAEGADKLFREAMKNIRNGFLYQKLADRGIPTDIMFKATEAAEAGRPKLKIKDIMKGRESGPKGLLEAAKKAGCLTIGKKLRFMKYNNWAKNTKNPADKRFKEYEKELFALRP